MGNAASRVAVVDVFLVGAQVGARRGTEAILLHYNGDGRVVDNNFYTM